MRSPTSSPRCKAICIVLSAAVIATLLVTVASTASAAHIPSTYTKTTTLTAGPGHGWEKTNTNCNRWGFGCFGGKFYMARGNRAADATWDFGDLQGTFQLYKEQHAGTPKNLTGTFRISVLEKRTGDETYRTAFKEVWNHNNRGGFFGSTTKIELDGRVKVQLEVITGRVTARKMRLKFVDLLPELKDAAKSLCRAGVVKAMKRWVSIPAALGAASIVVYTAPLIAAKVGGAAGAKLLAPKAASVLAWELPGPATAEDFVKGEIAGWVLGAVRNFFLGEWRRLMRLWDDAVRDNQYDCRYLKAPWYNFTTNGYGSYANDLAEIYGRRR